MSITSENMIDVTGHFILLYEENGLEWPFGRVWIDKEKWQRWVDALHLEVDFDRTHDSQDKQAGAGG